MRAFISINLPEQIATTLGSTISKFEKTGIDANFVNKDNLHFCLKFLGEVNEEALNKVKGAMIALSTQFKPFQINVKGIGAFPNTRFIKVLWIGAAAGTQEMTGIADILNNELKKADIPKDIRGFVPHITLARVKRVENKAALEKVMNELKDMDFGSFTAEKMCLIKSELTPSGPKHTEIFHVNFS